MLPLGKKYLEKRWQFVHVDDVARMIVYLLHRSDTDPPLNIFNLAGRGDLLTMQDCIDIAGAKLKRVPNRAACTAVLRLLWRLGISAIPPAALPYMLGSYTMDTTRLQQFLGGDYPRVIQYTNSDALRDSFKNSDSAARE
jgi:nucleoside-diphosphate-sugar epimerase